MDIMLAEKKNFIYGNDELNIPGCVKNGISEKDAETIYDQMIAFAKYAFNKSHAAAYAAISMETAYLKCHYPVVYMAGLLTSVTDKTDKLYNYVAECRKSGIGILTPDINRSDVGFTVEGGSIRFGLSAVKKVGETVSKEAVEEREKNGMYASVMDFAERNQELNSGALQSLALAGAFPFDINRRTVAEGIKEALKRKKEEKKGQVEGQLSFFDIAENMGSKNYDPDYFPILEEYGKDELLKKEKEATGVYLSGHPLDSYRGLLDECCTISASDMMKETDDEGNVISNGTVEDGQNVVFGGIVTEMRVVTTKKGDLMAFISVEGLDGTVSVVVFPEQYRTYKGIISESDAKVIIKGTVSLSDEKDNSVLAKEIRIMSYPHILWIKLKDKAEYNSRIDALIEISANHPGEDDMLIYLSVEKKERIFNRYVNASEVREQLEEWIGRENVAVTAKK